ncbi:hypothetical protein PR048_014098 [Dryococelus australis]|uniref:RNA-directed DNA polymerase n=1 Tax=Dryococelus australis TaxID=614101 RepID=A0ABQ9HDD6_9NEOP|nr:hypothetical protein PR048_014098 [Dryococelus australis]
MKSRARQVLYWPRMSQEIEVFVTKCCVCQKISVSSPREPLLSHERPSLPFNKIIVDIFTFEGKLHLVIIYYLSTWIELCQLQRGSAEEVNTAFKGVFATHGIPKLVIANHVPFWSRECLLLTQEWGFTIVTSSPRYLLSNGMAERTVQTANSMLKKCHEDESLIELLQYHLLPMCGISHSPSEILMSQNLTSVIPLSEHQLRPIAVDNFEEQLKEITRKSGDLGEGGSLPRVMRCWFKRKGLVPRSSGRQAHEPAIVLDEGLGWEGSTEELV